MSDNHRLRYPRIFGVAALVSALALLISGCSSSVVGNEDVHPGLEITGQEAVTTGTIYLPPGPVADATPEEVVLGFLNAGTGQTNDYATARLFLGSRLASEWKPQDQVLIITSPPEIVSVSDRAMTVAIDAIASVDATGHYVEKREQHELEFSLRQDQDNQWRIVEAPDGIVVAENQFQQLFMPQPLYFYDATYQILVPDVRWFAARSTRVTQTVSSLLAGPSPYLSDGVLRTAFPEGTQLAIDSVFLDEGVAQIDLTSQILNLNENQKRLMLTQLQTTLSNISGINRIQIMVDRSEVTIEPFVSGGPVKNPLINSNALVYRDGRLEIFQGGEASAFLNFGGQVGELEPQNIFFHERLNRAAVTNAEGIWSIQGGNLPRNISTQTPTITPVIDGHGNVWWIEDGVNGFFVFDRYRTDHISPEEFDTADVVSFAISRDSSRMLVLKQDSASTMSVWLYGIVRDDFGKTLSIQNPTLLYEEKGEAIMVNWVDQFSAVYGLKALDGTHHIISFEVGGLRTDQGEVPEFMHMNSGNSLSTLRILDTAGNMWQQVRQQRWEMMLQDVEVLVDQR